MNSALHILVYLILMNICKGLLCSQSFFLGQLKIKLDFHYYAVNLFFLVRSKSNSIFTNDTASVIQFLQFFLPVDLLNSAVRTPDCIQVNARLYLLVIFSEYTSGISFQEALALFHSKWSKVL